MAEEKTEYRRKLPHIHPKDGIFFITFCLYGALPKHKVGELSEKVESTKKNLLISSRIKQIAVTEYNEAIEEILHNELHGL